MVCIDYALSCFYITFPFNNTSWVLWAQSLHLFTKSRCQELRKSKVHTRVITMLVATQETLRFYTLDGTDEQLLPSLYVNTALKYINYLNTHSSVIALIVQLLCQAFVLLLLLSFTLFLLLRV